jgi:hypothetical protein|tara:strand:- start:118 stop:591 length:474 start_codon:yes stop_codon:yes gene_type:complete
MITTIEKSKRMFGWLSDKIDYLKPKYPSLWHTIYYGIRNHERGTVSIKRGNIKKIVWYACDPLKIYYHKKTTGHFCDECESDGVEDVMHMDKWRTFYRYIWSKKLRYHYTSTECEDKLFEPIENGSCVFGTTGRDWNEKTGRSIKRIVNFWGVYHGE